MHTAKTTHVGGHGYSIQYFFILYWQPLKVWLAIIFTSVCGVLIAGLTSGVAGVIMLFMVATCDFIIAERLTNDFLRKSLPDGRENRNAELGVTSTVITLSIAICGPTFGYCVDHFGLQPSLVGLGVLGWILGMIGLEALRRATA